MSVLKHVGLFLLPVSLTAVGAAWYLDLFSQESAVPEAVDTPELQVTTDFTQVRPRFESLNYPQEAQLAQLPREWPTAEWSQKIGTFVEEGYADNGFVQGEQEQLASSMRTEQTSPTIQSQDDLGLSLDDLDLSSLSPDLAMKVENALASNQQQPITQDVAVNDLERDAQQWRGRLPALNLQTHMYSSDTHRRWVKINNVEYHQGDVVDGQVTLKEIQPQSVIVEFQGEQIRIPALYEWQG
ncbi:general secretion pathway protein GspB [Vibrio sp. WZ-1]|uniref:general secretion pathway protein GspB n=1 Tax=Vibrio sp. WZ-1 TaxID=3454501 RepID=UPI003F861545